MLAELNADTKITNANIARYLLRCARIADLPTKALFPHKDIAVPVFIQ
jgi:hypothetical protein